MAYPDNPEVVSSYSFQIYAGKYRGIIYDHNMFIVQATGPNFKLRQVCASCTSLTATKLPNLK